MCMEDTVHIKCINEQKWAIKWSTHNLLQFNLYKTELSKEFHILNFMTVRYVPGHKGISWSSRYQYL